MSNIRHKKHSIEEFVEWLLSQNPIPQAAIYYHNNVIKIVVQHIPGKGFVVGYQDDRLSTTQNPIMEWADLVYLQIDNNAEAFRQAVMFSNDATLAIHSLGKIDKQSSSINLTESLLYASVQAEASYQRNTLLLNQK